MSSVPSDIIQKVLSAVEVSVSHQGVLPAGSDAGHAQWLSLWSVGTPAMTALALALNSKDTTVEGVEQSVAGWITAPTCAFSKHCLSFCAERLKLKTKAAMLAAKQQQRSGLQSTASTPTGQAASTLPSTTSVLDNLTKLTIETAALHFAKWIVASAKELSRQQQHALESDAASTLMSWVALVEADCAQDTEGEQQELLGGKRGKKSGSLSGTKRSRSQLGGELAATVPPPQCGRVRYVEGSVPPALALCGKKTNPSPLTFSVEWMPQELNKSSDQLPTSSTLSGTDEEAAAHLCALVHDAFGSVTKHGTSSVALTTIVPTVAKQQQQGTHAGGDGNSDERVQPAYVFDHHTAMLHRVRSVGSEGLCVESTVAVGYGDSFQ